MAARSNTRKTAQTRTREVTSSPVEAIKEVLADAPQVTPTARLRAAQIQAVRDYAAYRVARPRPRGWDIVEETWSTEDIAAAIGKARTTVGAVNKVASIVAAMDSHRQDVMSA